MRRAETSVHRPRSGSKSALTARFSVLSDAGKLAGAGTVTVGGGTAFGQGGWHRSEPVAKYGVTVVDGVIHGVYHNIAQGVNAAADLLIQHGITVI